MPISGMVIGEAGSFEGIVTIPDLVFVKEGLKETRKVQLLPVLMVFPEHPSIPVTSTNWPESVWLTAIVPMMRSAAPFAAVFLMVKSAAARWPLCTFPKFLYVGVTTRVGALVNVAVTVTSLFISMVQVGALPQLDHPAKAVPWGAEAVRVTLVPGR